MNHYDFNRIYKKVIEKLKIENNIYLHKYETGEDLINDIKIKKVDPDIIILDYILDREHRKMNGIEVASFCKKNVKDCHISMLTNFEPNEIPHDKMKMNIDNFLQHETLESDLISLIEYHSMANRK